MKTKILLLVLMLLISVSFISAEPTYQTNTIYLNPFYHENFIDSQPYDFQLDINPPDGVDHVVSAMIKFDVYISPTSSFTLTVNGQSCTPPTFLVHTTYANAHFGSIAFDCSNVITEAGSYNVTMLTDDDTGASYGWLEITYSNRPKATIEVFGTEYTYPQSAKVWLQLVNETGDDYIENAICYVHIYTPNNEQLIEKSPMQYHEDGVYYYDLITPVVQGVYPVIAECYYEAQSFDETVDRVVPIWVGSEFHNYTETQIDDGIYHGYREYLNGSQNIIDFYYGLNGGTNCWDTTPEEQLTGISIHWDGWYKSVANDLMRVWIYNHSSSSWLLLPNFGLPTSMPQTVTNLIETNNLTAIGLTNTTNGEVLIRLTDTPTIPDTATGGILTDYLSVSCQILTEGHWEEVRGASEMHISSEFNYYVEGEHDFGSSENVLASATVTNGEAGHMIINKTVASGTFETLSDQLVHFHAPTNIACDDIVYIEYFNASGPIENVSRESFRWHAEFNHCDAYWNRSLEPYAVYQHSMKINNAWMDDQYVHRSDADNLYGFVSGLCLFYQMANNYSNYTVPLTSSLNHSDSFYEACGHYLNEYYKFNVTTYEIESDFLDVETLADIERIESKIVYANQRYDKQHDLSTSLFEQITMVAAYSETAQNAPVSPYSAVFWSGQAQSNINYDLILEGLERLNNTPTNVWNHTTRNLTYYPPASLDINYTELGENVWTQPERTLTNMSNVAGDVWSTNQTVSAGIIEQFVTAIWDYVARYTHGIIG